MRNALEKLWAAFFIAVLLLPVATVVAGGLGASFGNLAGTQAGLTFWIMGIAAHQPVLSIPDLSFRRRLAIWLTAMTVGGITAGLGAIAISLLMQITADYALSASRQVTNVFWFVVAIRSAIRWAPVMVAWVVSGILVRRSTRRQVASLPAAPRSMPVRPAQAVDRQGAPRTTNRILREASWFVGCVVVVGVFVVIVMTTGAEERWPTASDGAAMVLSVFGMVTGIRVAAWLIRGGGRRFR